MKTQLQLVEVKGADPTCYAKPLVSCNKLLCELVLPDLTACLPHVASLQSRARLS